MLPNQIAYVPDTSRRFIEDFQKEKTIYKVELDEKMLVRYDMNLFTVASKAVSTIHDKNNRRFDQAKNLAVQYWQRLASETPIFEYLTKESIFLGEETRA